jgi:tetratricopeptide (TPR) repeat protein
MKPHAFVAMPFGTKPDALGQDIEFNQIYTDYIKTALVAAGLEVFRADEEMRAGDIRTDMFQELLVADLVVADLTLENPNVWYELGVRHALRSRGVVIVCGGRVTTAFDLYTDRKLRYGIKDGRLDPSTIEQDKQNLTAMVKNTMESWHGRKVSPVYHLMPNLEEPNWKFLRIGDVREFWEQHDTWEGRIDLARKGGYIGDVLVLADEAPVAAFRADAWIKAGEALRKAERFRFALEQIERGLEIDPRNIKGLREKGICLQRLGLASEPGHSLDRAREHCHDALENYPEDSELSALIGRIDKDAWSAAWRAPGKKSEELRNDAADEDALLRAAIDSYANAYRRDPRHYYSGINALSLMYLFRHLTGDTRFDPDARIMAGAVRFAAECEKEEDQLFWAKATLGDLEVLAGTPDSVKVAYKDAIARNAKDWFSLNSCRAQLQLFKELGFRPETVDVGIATFERALEKIAKPEDRWQPRQVFLFSGHMIDAPDRPTPRFPAEKEEMAAKRIAEVLDQLGAGPEDLVLSQAAAGGDLLFLEACQKRGTRCQILLPFDEPNFIQKSIMPSKNGDRWRDRYYLLKAELKYEPRIMPDELGPLPNGVDPYERCNLWLLYTALSSGLSKVRFMCLWNGGGSDGPGGTAHMYKEVERRTGRVTWIDTRQF